MRRVVLLGGLLLASAAGAGLGACGQSFSAAPAAGAEAGADVGGRLDVGTDVGTGLAEGGPSTTGWCVTHAATFCEDFDEAPTVTSFLSSWTNYEQNGGAFSFDTNAPPSGPNALRVMGSKNAQVLVLKSFGELAARPSSLRLEFDFRINSGGAVGFLSAAGFAAIIYGGTINSGYVALAIDSGPNISATWVAPTDAGIAPDGGAFNSAAVMSPFPNAGVWAGRLAMQIDYGSSKHGGKSGACLHVYQGAMEILVPCLPLPPELGDPKGISIALGDYAAGLVNTGTIDLEFDNVAYTVAK
jgi:hypothetical protein